MALKPMAIKNEVPDDVDEIKDTEVELEVVSTDEDEEENPNVADQLANVSNDDDEIKHAKPTAKEKYEELRKEYPEMEELYGQDIKKRIGKLTYDWKEEERQKEEAIKFAQSVQEENKKLREKQNEQDSAFLNEHTTRLTSQLDTAKKRYQEAYQANDAEAMAEANAQIALSASQLGQAQQTAERFKRVQEKPVDKEETVFTPTPSTRNRQPEIDPKAEAWAQRNEWFGEDQELSDAALIIHNRLVSQDGYLPQSDAYYAELDKRLLKNFPDNVKLTKKAPELQNSQQVITPVNDLGNKPRTKKKVTLTASQVRVARALGVPLAEYAKYVRQ
jgi:hypothetical protein